MIFPILLTVFFLGLALLMGIISVVRGLHASSAFQTPLIPDDCDCSVGNEVRVILMSGHCGEPAGDPLFDVHRGELEL
jgi:hypothetical protein